MNTVHIFDIDTTIADNKHRANLLNRICIVCLASKGTERRAICPTCNIETESQTSQEDWDAFFDPELVIKDVPNAKALVYADKLRAKDATIHFLTGRSEPARVVTELWLKTKFNKQDSETLIMRPNEEYGLLASKYKERAWSRLCQENGYKRDTLFYFYEDDPHVINMYGSHGIVIQCPEAWDFLVPDNTDKVEKAWAIL